MLSTRYFLPTTQHKSQIGNNQTITFSRSFGHILYALVTLFLLISKSEVAVHRREVVYSNYCKKIGIAAAKQGQIVDICPQMLSSDKICLQRFVDKLPFLPEAGLPWYQPAKVKLRLSRPLNQ